MYYVVYLDSWSIYTVDAAAVGVSITWAIKPTRGGLDDPWQYYIV